MSEPTAISESSGTPKQDEFLQSDRRPSYGVALIVLCALLTVQIGATGYGYWQLKQIRGRLADLEFSSDSNYYQQNTDFVGPQVGTIQFLRRGFSISFESVSYSQDGLTLTGMIGNPTQLWISSLTLNFSVRPYPYQVREKWNRDKFVFYNTSDFEIGKSQVSVGFLNPGSTSFFTVTIPNVKQTKDEPQLAVWFSGERYNYLK